jgi:hypothetical protein
MRIYTGFVLLAGVLALSLSTAVPAAAELFTCHDQPGQVLYSYEGTPDSYRSRANRHSRVRGSRAYGSADYSAHTRYHRAGSTPANHSRSRRYWHKRAQ